MQRDLTWWYDMHIFSTQSHPCSFFAYFLSYLFWLVDPIFSMLRHVESYFSRRRKRLQILWGFFFEKTSTNCRSVDVFVGSILLIIPRLPQMVDRLVVQLQDVVSALRSSQEPNVKNEIKTAKNYIQDADKLKQVCSLSDFSWCNCVNGKVTIFLAWHGR